jgi:REP element-mobilizing transposase RayT
VHRVADVRDAAQSRDSTRKFRFRETKGVVRALTCEMARIARVVVEGVPYHVTQRGNGRQQVFESGMDYGLYRSLLREYAGQHGVSVLAYCLMLNHTHLVCVPGRTRSQPRSVGQFRRASFGHFSRVPKIRCSATIRSPGEK